MNLQKLTMSFLQYFLMFAFLGVTKVNMLFFACLPCGE